MGSKISRSQHRTRNHARAHPSDNRRHIAKTPRRRPANRPGKAGRSSALKKRIASNLQAPKWVAFTGRQLSCGDPFLRILNSPPAALSLLHIIGLGTSHFIKFDTTVYPLQAAHIGYSPEEMKWEHTPTVPLFTAELVKRETVLCMIIFMAVVYRVQLVYREMGMGVLSGV